MNNGNKQNPRLSLCVTDVYLSIKYSESDDDSFLATLREKERQKVPIWCLQLPISHFFPACKNRYKGVTVCSRGCLLLLLFLLFLLLLRLIKVIFLWYVDFFLLLFSLPPPKKKFGRVSFSFPSLKKKCVTGRNASVPLYFLSLLMELQKKKLAPRLGIPEMIGIYSRVSPPLPPLHLP